MKRLLIILAIASGAVSAFAQADIIKSSGKTTTIVVADDNDVNRRSAALLQDFFRK